MRELFCLFFRSSPGSMHCCGPCCSLLLSGRKFREGCECLNVRWGLKLERIPRSHELCSRPSCVEQSPECACFQALSHEPRPSPVQLKGNSSLLKVCWAHISAQEICRSPLCGQFPESHLWWETDGGCDSQGHDPASKLENAMKWMRTF